MYSIEFDLFAVFALFDNVPDNIIQHCVSECGFICAEVWCGVIEENLHIHVQHICGSIRNRVCRLAAS